MQQARRDTGAPAPAESGEMVVLWLSPKGVERHAVEDVKALLERADEGLLWVDIPGFDEQANEVLSRVFSFDPAAIEEYRSLSLIPRVRRYNGYMLLTLHSLDYEGHLLELDQFIGPGYLVTAHGTHAKGVPIDEVLRQTRLAVQRVESGDLQPQSSTELSGAIVGEIVTWLEGFLGDVARRAGALDRRLREGRIGNRQEFVEDLYRVRHELTTIHNRCSQSREACTTLSDRSTSVLEGVKLIFDELGERFGRLRSLCDGEREFLQGVLDYYEATTATKMNIAMERLALIAALLIPFTISVGIFEMGIFPVARNSLGALAGVVLLALAATILIFRWTKRQGWW
jgi:magnesium transporter